MTKQKARLKDIAEKTGYGTNTVSLALRGSTRISAAAREKIAKAAEELDYVPNHIAKSLVSRRSHTVGLILHEITNPILTSAAEKIQRRLAARGYGVLFASSSGSPDEELRAIEMFRSRMIDGLLIYPVRHADLDHLKRLRARNFPVVLLIGIDDHEIDAVGIDEQAGAYDATRHLIDLGHRVRDRLLHATSFIRVRLEPKVIACVFGRGSDALVQHKRAGRGCYVEIRIFHVNGGGAGISCGNGAEAAGKCAEDRSSD